MISGQYSILYCCSDKANHVYLEEGIPEEVRDALKKKGHNVQATVTGYSRLMFGRGHIITKGAWWKGDDAIANDKAVLWVGTDPRGDGQALGY